MAYINGNEVMFSADVNITEQEIIYNNVEIVQAMGESTEKVMSQKAVTDIIERIGGRNLFTGEYVVGNINDDGSLGTLTYQVTTGFMPVKKGFYYYDICGGYAANIGHGASVVCFYDKDKNTISRRNYAKAKTENLETAEIYTDRFLAPADGFMRFQIDVGTFNKDQFCVIESTEAIRYLKDLPNYSYNASVRFDNIEKQADELRATAEKQADDVETVIRSIPVIIKERLVNETQNVGKYWTDTTRLAYKVPMMFNYDIKISCESGYVFEVDKWKSTDIIPDNFLSEHGWYSTPYIVTAGTIFTLLIKRTDNENISIDEYLNIKINRVTDEEETEESVLKRHQSTFNNLHAAAKYGYNTNGKANQDKRFTALITTDVHRDTVRLENAVEILNKANAIDCGFCLGDMQGGDFDENDGSWYTSIINTSKKPFYTVLGNHDNANYSADKVMTGATPTEAFAKFIQPTLGVLGQELTKPYYKILYDTYKIAVICLDNYDAPIDKGADGKFVIHRGAECISTDQLTWFIGALHSIPTDYHLLIARHSFPSGNERIESEWSQKARILNGDRIVYADNNIIPDIVDAWINGTALSKTYTPSSGFELCPTHNVSVDFTSRGKGNFVCYLIGHTHQDLICKSTAYENQIAVGFCATVLDNWNNYDTDLPRVVGTRSEDAITTVSIDTNSRKIMLVRFGSDLTFDLVKRDMTTIDY